MISVFAVACKPRFSAEKQWLYSAQHIMQWIAGVQIIQVASHEHFGGECVLRAGLLSSLTELRIVRRLDYVGALICSRTQCLVYSG
jgi:hypothetical protein